MSPVQDDGQDRLPTIVLTMIVKNEAHVIERCLSSMRPLIDAWCIVDTGSTDGTQDVIRSFMADLPGELVEEPWQGFAKSRTSALQHAARWGDYALTIDADVQVVIESGFDRRAFRRSLTADFYRVMLRDAVHYQRPMLTSTKLPFAYRGALHEFLVMPDGATDGGVVEGFHYRSSYDGARSQNPAKSADDAVTLVEALVSAEEPELDDRYVFYLANTLFDAGDLDMAENAYRARLSMGGWREEMYISWLRIGRIQWMQKRPIELVIDSFLRAQDVLPSRAEALCSAAQVAREADRLATAYIFSSAAIKIPKPQDSLFMEPDTYDWRSLYEFSIAAWHVGDFGDGLRACHKLLHDDLLPPAERAAVEGNLTVYPADAITW